MSMSRRARRRRTSTGARPGRTGPFPVDVEDHGDEFVVSADLPGLRKQDLDVSVRNDRVQITADFGERAEGRYHRTERERGPARRVVRLPEPVDETRLSAAYDAGVLWVTLPKRDRPKRVDIE